MTKIIQVADIHFGTESLQALSAFETIVDALEADALAVCGDLTQRGKRSEFQAASDWLEQFDMPQLVVAGNHDTPLLNLYERVMSPFERHDSYFKPFEGPVEVGKAVITGINTARGWQTRGNWAEGSVNLEQLEDAIADANAAEAETGVLICHHPFLSPPDAPMRTETKRGHRASRRLAQSKIRFLLTGHVHAPSVTVVDHDEEAYVAVSAGTLSTRLRSSPASFNVIDLNGPHATVTVFNLHGDRFVAEKPHVLNELSPAEETHVEV